VAGHRGILAPLPGTDYCPSKPESKCVNRFCQMLVSQLTRSHSQNLQMLADNYQFFERIDIPPVTVPVKWGNWSLQYGTNSVNPTDFPTESFPSWNSNVTNKTLVPSVNFN